jgi:HSP20 family protein
MALSERAGRHEHGDVADERRRHMTGTTADSSAQPADRLDWPSLDACFDTHSMRVEEVDEDGCFVVRAELPGIDVRRDLDLQIREHTLEIRARRSQQRSATHRGTRHSEFRYGRYWRLLTLPAGANEREARAVYKDGILEVRVPVTEPAGRRPTRVAVDAE